jgi:two-component system response regulator
MPQLPEAIFSRSLPMVMPAAVDILLVEDDPDDAELTLRALAKCGLKGKVIHVEDGAAAIDFICGQGGQGKKSGLGPARARAQLPRMVLLDLKLPKLNGFDVLERIRANQATSRLPVVILTSSNEERDKVQGYELGANGYVVKPLDFDEYNSALAAISHFWVGINQPAP